jgi:hypothetical protein
MEVKLLALFTSTLDVCLYKLITRKILNLVINMILCFCYKGNKTTCYSFKFTDTVKYSSHNLYSHI